MASKEALVLVLYCGGTIGMIRQNDKSGFEPFPSFLTETLRSQSRFHDPVGDSIFSWSNTADRFKAWSDVFTRSPSGSSTPQLGAHAKKLSQDLVKEAASRATAPKPPIHSDTGVSTPRSHSVQPSGTPFGPPVTVRSTYPDGVSKHHAYSTTLSPTGDYLDLELPSLVTPKINEKRIRYVVLEYDPLLDSSDMDIPDWLRIARDIQANYKAGFDGFIVLHGTDTMAYTSSALSFLLENLGKTVIVTGAQVPLSQLRNDAIENMLGALMIAGTYIIPEVTLYFASKLYRGNRSSKVSNNALSAFHSPNMSPLADVGISIAINWALVERPRDVLPFRAHDRMSNNVAVLRLFPGLNTATVRSFLAPPLEGVVLESYGAGNAPSRPDLLEVFKEATDRGLVILNITQCAQGEVAAIYSLGKKLQAVGVIPGGDMTPECALAKLSYLLGKTELKRARVRELLRKPLRGELTLRDHPHALQGANGIQNAGMGMLLAHILHAPPSAVERPRAVDETQTAVASPSQGDVVKATETILPYLIHQAALTNDTAKLRWHLEALSSLEAASTSTAHVGTSMSAPAIKITDSSTGSHAPIDRAHALHAAAANGHLEAVDALVRAGASVHAKDVTGATALFLAANARHAPVVQLLRDAGAHLTAAEVQYAHALLEAGIAQPEVWRLADA